jgi:hypothetical protein
MSRLDCSLQSSVAGAIGGATRTAWNPLERAGRMVPADCLIASGRHMSVPRLRGVATRHQLASGVEPAARLGRALLEAGIAEANDWRPAEGNPLIFVEKALQQWAEAHGASEIGTGFDLALALVTDLNPYGHEEPSAEPVEQLYLVLEPETAGYIVLGPLLRRLEALHPRLPATFFHLFTSALNRWVRVYDYREAQERVVMLREWYEGDPDGENAELPDIAGATPACIAGRKPLSRNFAKQLVRQMSDANLRAILGGAVALSDAAGKKERPALGDGISEQLSDCNPPLPVLLTVFEKHDAIEGCFDEESQGMMECQPEPNLILPLAIGDVGSVRRAFDVAEVVCEVLVRAARLLKLIMADVQ